MTAAAPRLRQSMASLHTWTGLLFGWLLYAMFLTGAASYFREEISQWMRPEVPALEQPPDAADSAARAFASLQALAPGASQWVIELAGERTNVVAASWRAANDSGSAMLDPRTGSALFPRETYGGEFFYYFHFSLHYLPRAAARWLVGLATMFMLVALVSGVVTHKKIFADFFTFRRGKGPRSWLDAHNALSVTALPFHLMITYSGLITLMTLYMPWGADAALDSALLRQSLRAEMTAFLPAGAASRKAAPSAGVSAMVREAERRWGTGRVARLIVDNPGDAASRVKIVRGDAQRVSVSPRYLTFDGASGELLEAKDRSGHAAETRGVLYGLHVGRFADVALRWLYFLAGLAGAAMVATGLLLWTARRRARPGNAQTPPLGLRLAQRLNIVVIAGLPVAMAAFLWANRLLPIELAERREWEIHLFFIMWVAMLVHAGKRRMQRAWAEQLAAAAALLAALPLASELTGNRGLLTSLRAGDGVFAVLELTLAGLAVAFAATALKIARRR